MKKKLLIVFICLLVVATGAGVWGYNYFFGVDDELRMQLIQEFNDDFFSFQGIDLKDTVSEEILMGEKSVAKNEITEETISIRYAGKFEKLEEAVEDKIEVLIKSAYKEYQQQNAINQLNQGQLVRKYLQAGNMLEEAVEAMFQDMLKEMEAELQVNQLPTDLVYEVREAYNAMIKQKKSAIMKQIEGIN